MPTAREALDSLTRSDLLAAAERTALEIVPAEIAASTAAILADCIEVALSFSEAVSDEDLQAAALKGYGALGELITSQPDPTGTIIAVDARLKAHLEARIPTANQKTRNQLYLRMFLTLLGDVSDAAGCPQPDFKIERTNRLLRRR